MKINQHFVLVVFFQFLIFNKVLSFSEESTENLKKDYFVDEQKFLREIELKEGGYKKFKPKSLTLNKIKKEIFSLKIDFLIQVKMIGFDEDGYESLLFKSEIFDSYFAPQLFGISPFRSHQENKGISIRPNLEVEFEILPKTSVLTRKLNLAISSGITLHDSRIGKPGAKLAGEGQFTHDHLRGTPAEINQEIVEGLLEEYHLFDKRQQYTRAQNSKQKNSNKDKRKKQIYTIYVLSTREKRDYVYVDADETSCSRSLGMHHTERFLWVDLTSSPSEYGPLPGLTSHSSRDGVITKYSLPYLRNFQKTKTNFRKTKFVASLCSWLRNVLDFMVIPDLYSLPMKSALSEKIELQLITITEQKDKDTNWDVFQETINQLDWQGAEIELKTKTISLDQIDWIHMAFQYSLKQNLIVDSNELHYWLLKFNKEIQKDLKLLELQSKNSNGMKSDNGGGNGKGNDGDGNDNYNGNDNDNDNSGGTNYNSETVLTFPVYHFQLFRNNQTVLFDSKRRVVGFEEMVLAIETQLVHDNEVFTSVQTGLFCSSSGNTKILNYNSEDRQEIFKQSFPYLLRSLFGTLPVHHHLTKDLKLSHDYLWAISSLPFSCSSGQVLYVYQRDLAHRGVIYSLIDLHISEFLQIISKFDKFRKKLSQIFNTNQLNILIKRLDLINLKFEKINYSLSQFDYQYALYLAHSLKYDIAEIESLVRQTSKQLYPTYHCPKQLFNNNNITNITHFEEGVNKKSRFPPIPLIIIIFLMILFNFVLFLKLFKKI
ncbi:transmembrane protein-related [Anaeramoeba flamelloides]|uniref:Transmembrane protein-related n=1 Tax=Anaeramoeba flamelloides TaxID=1746091 RepID=A0ABQ8YQS7_9EUKA|nr:transmembrane protein-related [Anaeramoeba flamelloides]